MTSRLVAPFLVLVVAAGGVVAQERARVLEPESIIALERRISLKKSPEKYRAELDVVRATAGATAVHFVTIAIRGPVGLEIEGGNWMFMKRLEIDLGWERFSLMVLPDHRKDELQIALESQPINGPGTPFAWPTEDQRATWSVEERSFPITHSQLRSLLESQSLAFRILGATARESNHTLSGKRLNRLKEWIRENVPPL